VIAKPISAIKSWAAIPIPYPVDILVDMSALNDSFSRSQSRRWERVMLFFINVLRFIKRYWGWPCRLCVIGRASRTLFLL
jgi:hypothetical protein